MKKTIIAATLLALAAANLPTAKAGDCGWAPAGRILTGVAAGVVIASTLDYQSAHYPVTHSQYAPCPMPVVYAPASLIYAPAPVVYGSAPVVVYPRPLFITPRPLVNMNYGYGRGHGHGYRR